MYPEVLKENSYSATPARKAVIEALRQRAGLLAAADIYELLNKRFDLSTIYRTLGLFKKLGIVFSERVGDRDYFCFSGKSHHHIICRSCGYSECLPLREELEISLNFTKVEHRLVSLGICSGCGGENIG